MDTAMRDYRTASSTEQRLLGVLHRQSFTLDRLATLADLNWAQTFFLVDRLARAGRVALHRTASCEYVVSIRGKACSDTENRP